MTNIAIIPARGGSKRIPKKNIKDFLGKPIIAYSIETALKSNLFDKVVVSTDSEEIADISIEYGAEVPFKRPFYLADDFIGTDQVLMHSIEWLKNNDFLYDYACCISATAPFLNEKYLKEGLELIKKEDFSSICSITMYSYPIFRAFQINSKGHMEMFWINIVIKELRIYLQLIMMQGNLIGSRLKII